MRSNWDFTLLLATLPTRDALSPKDSPDPVFLLASCLASSVCANNQSLVIMYICSKCNTLQRGTTEKVAKVSTHQRVTRWVSTFPETVSDTLRAAWLILSPVNRSSKNSAPMALPPGATLETNQAWAIRKHTSSAGGVLGLVDVTLVRHDGCRW